MAEEEISFFAKYGEWVAVKKRAIDAKTKPEEVVAILASIGETTSRKAFDFSGINRASIEEYAAKLTKGKRKGLSNLAEIFGNLKQNEMKEQLTAACKEEKLYPIAEAYFIKTILSQLGFSPLINAEMLSKIYPELKIPKPRGRMKK